MEMSESVERKLDAKHQVCAREIEEAFQNRLQPLLIDRRPEHKTSPPTKWFLARTDKGRLLKIAYIVRDGQVVVKSAYEPKQPTIDYYCRKIKKQITDL